MIKFNSFSQTAKSMVHVIHISQVIITYTLELSASLRKMYVRSPSIYIYISNGLCLSMLPQSAQHAHAWMITFIVEKVNNNIYIYIYQDQPVIQPATPINHWQSNSHQTGNVQQSTNSHNIRGIRSTLNMINIYQHIVVPGQTASWWPTNTFNCLFLWENISIWISI